MLSYRLGTVNDFPECEGYSKKVKKHITIVVQFLRSEGNSKFQPGKQDVKRIQKSETVQTYMNVLSDYLKNLFEKFRAENPTIDVSFRSFCRWRPKYVLPTRILSRSS